MIKKISFLLFLFFCTLSYSQKEGDSIDYFIEKNELIKALDYGRSKSNYYLENKQYDKYCETCVKKALVYGRLNDHDKSLHTLLNALNVSKKNGLKGSANILEQIGTRYSLIRDTTKAFKNYHSALKIGLTEKDTASLVNIYQNLFRLYSEKDIDSSYIYMNKKFALDKQTKSYKGIAISYNNHFAYYTLIGEPKIAKTYLDSCYYFTQKYKLRSQNLSALFNLGYYETESNNDFKKAESIYQQINKEFQKEMTTNDHIGLYSSFVYVYENLDDFERANYYNTLLHEYNDKMYSEKLMGVEWVNDARAHIRKVEADTYALMLTTDDHENQVLLEDIAKRGQIFNENLTKIEALPLDDKEKNDLVKIRSDVLKYREVRSKVLDLAKQNKNAEKSRSAEVLCVRFSVPTNHCCS